jgi:ketosteroid isomerase-like protein
MDHDATDDGTIFATRQHRELKPVMGSEPPLHYHSLLVERGGRIHRYREFVIYHGDQIYPEYLVAYKRGHR